MLFWMQFWVLGCPVKAVIPGWGVFLVSFGYGCWMIIAAILGKMAVPGFATSVVLISLRMGTALMILSVIGEYLWRIFDEVRKRPEIVIDEIR